MTKYTTYFSITIIFIVFSFLNSVSGQGATIQGLITTESGEPLIGVSISEKGTTNGTISDIDGNYSLEVSEAAILEFSYLGYFTQEVLVAGQRTINIQLAEQASKLDEVVVVGYGTEQKSNLTGSVSSIKSEDLTMVPVASTTGLIAGRSPGVLTKQNSGLPGADDTSISIRGFAGNPLVLVDGVQMVGGLTRIDPNDIESINILKDASAAVYGSRAGNGVILVTTKRGKAGPAQISYDGSITFQEATAFLEHVNAGQYVELAREADLMDLGDINATYDAAALENYRSGAPGFEGGDWTGALVNNFAPLQQHSVKVSGGTKNARYFSSLGFTQQESFFSSRDYDYDRLNARTNIDIDISENILFSMDLSYRYDWRESARDIPGVYNDLATALPIYPIELPDPSLGVAYTGFSQRNPIASSTQSDFGWNKRRDDTFRGKVKLEYRLPFFNAVKVRAEVNTVQLNRSTKALRTPYQVYQYDPINDAYINEGLNTPTSSISEIQFRSNQIYPLIALDYGQSFGEHDLKFLALGEQLSETFSTFRAARNDLLSTSIPELFSGSEDFQTNNGSSGTAIGRKSVVARLNYKFKDRYLFEATMRADGNVLFAPETRWGYFPSVSAGWIVTQEPWLAGKTGVLDRLKIRASYSLLGDDTANGLSGFDYLTGYSQVNTNDPYLLGNNSVQPQIATLGLVNPLLTWEEITLYNLGLEMGFFEGKLSAEVDVFYRNREGLLGQNLKAIPSTFGGALPLVNLNSRNNRGIEVLLSYRENIGKASIEISPNFTFARARWGDVFDEEDFTDPDQLRINGREGQWVNRNFGYVSDGIFMSQADIDNYNVIQDDLDNSTLRPGDIRYVDLNGDGTIDFRDQEQIAFAGGLPEISYGTNIGFFYKNFSFNMLLQGASRFSVNINGSARNMFSNFSTPLSYHYDLRWQPDPENPSVNINPDAALPAATLSPGANNNRNSDFYRIDVTYMRIKNVNLAFNIDKSLIERVGIKNLQIYAATENLFTFSNLGIYANSFDPEAAGGNPSRNYPLNRNFSFGLRTTF